MHIPRFILSSDVDGLVKIVIFVVMAIIWGIAGLANAAKKAGEQAKRRAAPRQPSPPPLAQAIGQRAPVQRPAAAQQRMPASRPVPGGFAPSVVARAGALAQMTARKPASAPAARQPISPAAPVARAGAGSLAPVKSAAAASVRVVPHGASAAAIRRWLRPDSLQKQFILTELLQPPKALRPSPE